MSMYDLQLWLMGVGEDKNTSVFIKHDYFSIPISDIIISIVSLRVVKYQNFIGQDYSSELKRERWGGGGA